MADDQLAGVGIACRRSGLPGGGGGSPGVSSMTEDEINAILSGITDSRQKKVCSYALHRVGFPYSQDMRDSGNYYDCSSLAYYSWKDAGVDISYGGATTAAAEAQGLDEAGNVAPSKVTEKNKRNKYHEVNYCYGEGESL